MSEAANGLITGQPGKVHLGEIRLRLGRSTLPVLRDNAGVMVSVSTNAIHLKATDDDEWRAAEPLVYGPGDSSIYELDLTTKERIRRVIINLGRSEIRIFHDDPYEVEDFFETSFISSQVYWIKAFRKMLEERFGIVVEEEEDPEGSGL